MSAQRVRSPTVSEGYLGVVPFGISVRIVMVALANGRATDTV